ncbi:MAG: ribosome biogenesis GTPase Der [Oscillospiraceae bacterium]|nr:ribosome biogenesis GTPase Der [Oscillospiraceae bacterium]
MAKPIVAVVGRPNVGKSTLFNYLSGRRISIIDDTPGVTRDRIYADVEWRGRFFTMVDTGGIEPFTEDPIMQQMMYQAQIAVETADLIVFIVDARDGLTPADEDVAELLRKSQKPVVVAANKADRPGPMPPEAYEFYDMALGEVLSISSAQGLGIGDLLDAVHELLPPEPTGEEGPEAVKVAIIGKPNVGKSSLLNKILGEERVITSDKPGTTRDAVDALYSEGGSDYILIDTAGIRRKSKINEAIERYSVMRALTAIERSDLCLIMIDACDGVTEQDARIAGYAHEAGKSSIILINKWDLIDKETGTLEEYRETVLERLAFMRYAPVIFVSALTGQRVRNIFRTIDKVFANASFRVPTGLLNDVLNEAIATAQPPSDKGRRLRLYYMTQVGVRPPSFTLFVNDVELVHYSYSRYIENTLRRAFDFEGVPIRLFNRQRSEKDL